MKIRVTFKHLPAGGKYKKGRWHYVRYNTKGSVWEPENVSHDYWLPKWIWKRI